MLSDADGRDRAGLLAECERLAVLPQAVAAVDLALWDLAGRRADSRSGSSWARRPPARRGQPHAVGHGPAGAAAEAGAARAAGYRCLKAKVAIGDDAGRLAAIRAACRTATIALRVDANGAWTVAEAQAGLRVLARSAIELCEEPVRGPSAMARLAGLTDVPLALDETRLDPRSAGSTGCARPWG